MFSFGHYPNYLSKAQPAAGQPGPSDDDDDDDDDDHDDDDEDDDDDDDNDDLFEDIR